MTKKNNKRPIPLRAKKALRNFLEAVSSLKKNDLKPFDGTLYINGVPHKLDLPAKATVATLPSSQQQAHPHRLDLQPKRNVIYGIGLKLGRKSI